MGRLRKIIREEIDDFGWMEDIPYVPERYGYYIWKGWGGRKPLGFSHTKVRVGDRIFIDAVDRPETGYHGVYFSSADNPRVKDVTNLMIWDRLVRNGTIIPDTMNESEDLDWIKSINIPIDQMVSNALSPEYYVKTYGAFERTFAVKKPNEGGYFFVFSLGDTIEEVLEVAKSEYKRLLWHGDNDYVQEYGEIYQRLKDYVASMENSINESEDFGWIRNLEPEFDVDTSEDYHGWWKYSGKELIKRLGLHDFEAEISSSDWDGTVRVESNYGYFYSETSGISESGNCPKSIFITSVVWGKRKEFRLDISDCKRDSWEIFNRHIEENVDVPGHSLLKKTDVNESEGDFDWMGKGVILDDPRKLNHGDIFRYDFRWHDSSDFQFVGLDDYDGQRFKIVGRRPRTKVEGGGVDYTFIKVDEDGNSVDSIRHNLHTGTIFFHGGTFTLLEKAPTAY
jgi:hypothetical protein